MWRRVDLVWTDVSEEHIAFIYPEDEGDTLLRNVGSHKIYTVPHRRRRHFSFITVFTSPYPEPDESTPPHPISQRPIFKSYIHFLSLRSFIQGIRPGPRLLVIFRNKHMITGMNC
jgi:hypothetical protein